MPSGRGWVECEEEEKMAWLDLCSLRGLWGGLGLPWGSGKGCVCLCLSTESSWATSLPAPIKIQGLLTAVVL